MFRPAFALLLLLSACSGSSNPPSQPDPPPARPPLQESDETGDERDAPVRCATDSDCPNLSCGPCTSGQTVTRMHSLVECYRNPCPGAVAVCREGVCKVH